MKYVVKDALDVVYAIEETPIEGAHKLEAASLYLGDAERCGHPDAAPWVSVRRPLRLLELTDDEGAAALAEGVPVLEREG